jgi:hypothetical protein
MTLELADARIKSLPNDAYYIPDFITKEEEEGLLRKVSIVPRRSPSFVAESQACDLRYLLMLLPHQFTRH